MDTQQYEKIDETFKLGIKFLIISLLFIPIIELILLILHLIIWRKYPVSLFTSTDKWIILIELLLLPLLHEYIHAITYRKMGNLPRGTVQFRCNLPINLSVHYTEIVPINVRKWSTIMPTIIICPILLIIGLSINNIFQTLFAGFMLIGGISDMYDLIKLRNYQANCFIEDKLGICGCIIYKPKIDL